jgi:hypothetical protein
MGFIRTDAIVDAFLRFGTSDADLNESLRILAAYLLVENDTYESNELGGAYRVTAAGRYFIRILMNKFAYLDLVFQDTPIADRVVFDTVEKLVASRDLDDRFARVAAFVDYMLGEEEREHAAILSTSDSIPLRERIIPELRKAFESDKVFIKKGRKRRESKAEKTPYEPKV